MILSDNEIKNELLIMFKELLDILSDEDIIAGLNEQQREMFDNLPEEKQQQIIKKNL